VQSSSCSEEDASEIEVLSSSQSEAEFVMAPSVPSESEDDEPTKGDGEAAVLKENDSHIECFIASCMQIRRTYKDGSEVFGDLVQGPNGFANVRFPGEPDRATEIPNLALEPVCKTQAAVVAANRAVRAEKKPRKRPAATEAGSTSPAVADVSSCAAETGLLQSFKRPAAADAVAPTPKHDSSQRPAASGTSKEYKSSEKHRVYSRAYHKTKSLLQKEGMPVEDAKVAAQKAAHAAILEMQA
jgi:hypothetical protein